MIIVNTSLVSSFFGFHLDPGNLACIVMRASEMMGGREIVPLVDTMLNVRMSHAPKIESAFVLVPENKNANVELKIDA